jgi:hypothetical protein
MDAFAIPAILPRPEGQRYSDSMENRAARFIAFACPRFVWISSISFLQELEACLQQVDCLLGRYGG